MPPVTPITPAIQAPLANSLAPNSAPVAASPLAASRPGGSATAAQPSQADRRIQQTARQFESMFMTEMLRHARPDPKAAGPFAGGAGEGAWRVLMDQALGEAAATGGPAGDRGLGHAIEQALRDAQHPHRSTTR